MKISVHALDDKKKEWTKVFEFPGTFENTGSITVKVKKDDLPPEVIDRVTKLKIERAELVLDFIFPDFEDLPEKLAVENLKDLAKYALPRQKNCVFESLPLFH